MYRNEQQPIFLEITHNKASKNNNKTHCIHEENSCVRVISVCYSNYIIMSRVWLVTILLSNTHTHAHTHARTTHTHARFFSNTFCVPEILREFITQFRWSLKRSLEHAGQGREANCSATQQILSSLPCIDRPFASPSTRLIIIVRALSQNNAESELSLFFHLVCASLQARQRTRTRKL